MVSTDHGGPNHSKVNLEQAYPEVLKAREAVPGLTLFYGMELDTPQADHSSLIIPKNDQESQTLYNIESKFNPRDPFPTDPKRNTESNMIDALNYMKNLAEPPVLFANHPSRSASGARRLGSRYTAGVPKLERYSTKCIRWYGGGTWSSGWCFQSRRLH